MNIRGKNIPGTGFQYLLLALFSIILIFSPAARGVVSAWSGLLTAAFSYLIIFLCSFNILNRGSEQAAMPRVIDVIKKDPMEKVFFICVLVLAILSILSAVFSVYKHDSFYSLLIVFSYAGLYFAALSSLTRAGRKYLLFLVIFIAAALSIFGIMQYFGIIDNNWWMRQDFLSSTYVNHNHFAGYLELLIPSAIILFLNALFYKRHGTIIAKIFMTLSLVIMVYAFILTQSRGAWISLFVSLAFMGVVSVYKTITKKVFYVITVIMLFFTPILFYFGGDIVSGRIRTVMDIGTDRDPSGGRFIVWRGAINMVKARPLIGFGIGAFDRAFYRYRLEKFRARAIFAHNDYLQSASEMGILAPFVIIVILSILILMGLRCQDNVYAFGPAIGILSFALHGFVDFNFHIGANMILFVILAAIITGEYNAERK